MVCIECLVVPILFVVAAYFKQLVTFIQSYFFPSRASSTVAPPPFDPSTINLAAHGLPAATVDPFKLSASMADEEKEGPASVPQAEADEGEVVSGTTVRRRQ